jgi:hypothetical protein
MQCSNSGKEASARSLMHSDDSDDEDADLMLPSQRRERDRRSSRTKSAERVSEGAQPPALDAQPAPTNRSRNADVLNRLNGRSGTRAKPRAVPDFPIETNQPPRAMAVADDAAGDTASPPRHTATPTVPVGRGVSKPDNDLVLLLREKPKNTADLRTPASFQQYFSGISRDRMLILLDHAYSNVLDEAEKKEKVEKRLRLLDGFMV